MRVCKYMPAAGMVLLSACLVAPLGCGKKDDKKGGTTTIVDPRGQKGNGGDKDYFLFAPTDRKSHDYHIRLKIDKENKTAHATVYDKDDSEIQPVETELLTLTIKSDKTQIELKCQTDKKDAKGKCAHFTGMHNRLASGVDPAQIEIQTFIAKKQYVFGLDKDDH